MWTVQERQSGKYLVSKAAVAENNTWITDNDIITVSLRTCMWTVQARQSGKRLVSKQQLQDNTLITDNDIITVSSKVTERWLYGIGNI